MSQLEPPDGPDCWSDVEEFVHGEDRLEAEGCICIEKGNGFVVDLVANTEEIRSNVKVGMNGPRVDAAAYEVAARFDFGVLDPLSNRMIAVDKDMARKKDLIDLVPDLAWKVQKEKGLGVGHDVWRGVWSVTPVSHEHSGESNGRGVVTSLCE